MSDVKVRLRYWLTGLGYEKGQAAEIIDVNGNTRILLCGSTVWQGLEVATDSQHEEEA